MKILNVMLAGTMLALGIAAGAQDPTPEHVAIMKDLGKYMGAIRKGVDVEQNATMLADAMKKVAPMIKAYPGDTKAAMKSCGDTRKGALAVAAAAKAGNKEGIAEGMKAMGAGCKACHEAHREKISDTQYKIK